ncbi:hypothetical protein FQR65_LT12239 [Abscondita terminalis]|nr:hypothetical protein FQR65_LT12239 [Abscondita terminalis]
MSEMTTTTICLGQIKQESEFDLNDDLKPILKLELPPEQYPNITDNPVACNTCKQEIDVEHQFDTIFMKEEIKEELVEDGINTEDLVDDDSILFNTDIPLVKKTYSILHARWKTYHYIRRGHCIRPTGEAWRLTRVERME